MGIRDVQTERKNDGVGCVVAKSNNDSDSDIPNNKTYQEKGGVISNLEICKVHLTRCQFDKKD